jgi:hypothetical protein
MLRTRERTPTHSPFDVFIFEIAIESIKELGGALDSMHAHPHYIFLKLPNMGFHHNYVGINI